MKMNRSIFRFFLVTLFLLIRFTLLGITITREEITRYALTRQYCVSWSPSKNFVKLTNDYGETAIFESNFNPENTYNYEAYVYGGEDSEDEFLNRIIGGTCPGGINNYNRLHSTTWLYEI
jgi:hypothetical protein